jgi:hypothetical protein
MYWQHAEQFINEYLGYHIMARTAAAIEGHAGGRLYYLNVLETQFSPWFYLVPFALAFSLRDNIKRESRSRILLLVAAVVFILYSLIVRTKISWYIVPVYPALATFTAALVVKAYKHSEPILLSGLLVAVFAAALATPMKILLLFGAAGSLMMLLTRKLTLRPVLLFIPAFLIAAGLNNLRPLYTKKDGPVAELARVIASTTPKDREPLIMFNGAHHPTLFVHHPTFLFYSDRPILRARTQEDLSGYIKEYQIKGIILHKESHEPLSRIYNLHVHAEAGSFVYATNTD